MTLRVVLAENVEYDDEEIIFDCGRADIDDRNEVLTIVDENNIVVGYVPLDNLLLVETVKNGRGQMTGRKVRT